MKRCPTVPVAPSTPTFICLPSCRPCIVVTCDSPEAEEPGGEMVVLAHDVKTEYRPLRIVLARRDLPYLGACDEARIVTPDCPVGAA